MTGVRCPCDCNASCNSRPLNPGICMSVIRHVVSAITSDPRKCSADVKVMTLYPKDSTSAAMPSRASASSSTIEINGASDIPVARRERLADQDRYGTLIHIQKASNRWLRLFRLSSGLEKRLALRRSACYSTLFCDHLPNRRFME